MADQMTPNQPIPETNPGTEIPADEQFVDAAEQAGFASADMLPGPEPEYLVLEWHADSRHVRPRSRQYYSSLLVLAILLSLILFFANQVALIVLLWALLFLSYVLARVRPESVRIQITTYGIRYQDQLVLWEDISRFWVRDVHGFSQVYLEVPGQILRQYILLPSNAASSVPVSVDDIVDLIGRVVPYEEPLPNRFDLWVQWLEEKFPLESQAVSAPPVAPQTPPPASSAVETPQVPSVSPEAVPPVLPVGPDQSAR